MVAWRLFGRHRTYGNGLARASLRGWIYLLVAVCGSAVLPGLSRALGPARVPLAAATLVVYWWGAVLHLVPFESGAGYCRALAVDFVVITAAYTAHVGVYCGRSPATAASLALSATVAAANVAAVANGRDIQYDARARRARLACGIPHTLLLAAVEWSRAGDARLAALVVGGKLAAFLYFYLGGRIDAPTHFKFATIPGKWDVHENFHVAVLGVHLAQVLAVGRQAGPGPYDHLCTAQDYS